MESQPSGKPAALPGIGRDLRNIKQHGSASLAELQQFLATMRGKSTQEMLGALAESGLVRATIQATLGCLVLMLAFTVGPYYLRGDTAASPAPADTKTSAPANAAPAAAAPPASTNNAANNSAAPAAAASPSATPGAPADLERAAKALGLDETKPADPKANPREKDLDSLLDKIK